MGIYHFFQYSSSLHSSSLFSIPSWHQLTWQLGIKKCHFVLEFPGLEYRIVRYSSPLNSGINLYWPQLLENKIMTIDTRVHKTQVLCQQYHNPLNSGINLYWPQECKIMSIDTRVHETQVLCQQYPSALNSSINLYVPQILECKNQALKIFTSIGMKLLIAVLLKSLCPFDFLVNIFFLFDKLILVNEVRTSCK